MAKFSWCLLKDHTHCQVESGRSKCDCACKDHGKNYTPPQSEPLLLDEIAAKYGKES